MTIAQDPRECVAHLRDSREYLDSAEDDFVNGRYKATASNACLSTIRSSDAGGVAELGEQWSGRDHGGATALLRTTSGGDRGAELLGKAVAAKNENQYRIIETTEGQALALLEGARELNDLARNAILRAGFLGK